MVDNSVFVLEIEKKCKERSSRWPKLRLEGDCFWEEGFIINYYDTSDLSKLNQLLESEHNSSELNAALQVACENGDIAIVDFLLSNKADPNFVLNENDYFLDCRYTSIAVALYRNGCIDIFEKTAKKELDTQSNWYSFHMSLIGQHFESYATIRKYEMDNKDNNQIIQNCKRQREDIVALLSMIKDVFPKPLPELCIPGDFRFDCPFSFQEMLNDKGDEIDSRFARRVMSLLNPGTPIFEY